MHKTNFMLPLCVAAILLTSGCMSPLHKAISRNDASAVTELIDQGADIHQRYGYSPHAGKTALHWAAFWGNLEIVRVLLDKGANIESKDNGGFTPLCEAAYLANVSVARLLMERGADADEAIANLRRRKSTVIKDYESGYIDAIELINGLRKSSAPVQGPGSSYGAPSAIPLPMDNVAPF